MIFQIVLATLSISMTIGSGLGLNGVEVGFLAFGIGLAISICAKDT